MPRRELLTSAQREELLAFPTEEVDLIRHYTFSAHDFAVIRRCRGGHNRLGFAVQLCYLRFPGRLITFNVTPAPAK
jgi:TnpA family transposase